MSNTKQQIEEMISDFGEDSISYGEELHTGRVKSDDEIKSDSAELLRKQTEIVEAIDRLVAEANTPVTICGKPLEEVVVILNALELERIADMKMTMSNLDKWAKLVREDMYEATQKALNKVVDDTIARSKSQLTNKDTK